MCFLYPICLKIQVLPSFSGFHSLIKNPFQKGNYGLPISDSHYPIQLSVIYCCTDNLLSFHRNLKEKTIFSTSYATKEKEKKKRIRNTVLFKDSSFKMQDYPRRCPQQWQWHPLTVNITCYWKLEWSRGKIIPTRLAPSHLRHRRRSSWPRWWPRSSASWVLKIWTLRRIGRRGEAIWGGHSWPRPPWLELDLRSLERSNSDEREQEIWKLNILLN